MAEKLEPGLEFSKVVGNIYTGSLYLSLVSLLFHKSEQEVRNKRIMMYSYGSGVATTLFSFKVRDCYKKSKCIDSVEIENKFKNRVITSISDFDNYSR